MQRLQQQPDLHAVSYMNMMMTPATPAVLLASYVSFHKGNRYGRTTLSLSNDDRQIILISTYLIFIFIIVRLSTVFYCERIENNKKLNIKYILN